MPSYKVYWEIDIEADSGREAAERALEIQRKPGSMATCFTVWREGSGRKEDFDLSEEEE